MSETKLSARNLKSLLLKLIVAQPNFANDPFRLRDIIHVGTTEVAEDEYAVTLTPKAENIADMLGFSGPVVLHALDGETNVAQLETCLQHAGLNVVGLYFGKGQFIPATLEQIVDRAIPGLVALVVEDPEPLVTAYENSIDA